MGRLRPRWGAAPSERGTLNRDARATSSDEASSVGLHLSPNVLFPGGVVAPCEEVHEVQLYTSVFQRKQCSDLESAQLLRDPAPLLAVTGEAYGGPSERHPCKVARKQFRRGGGPTTLSRHALSGGANRPFQLP